MLAVVENLPSSAGHLRDADSVPGSGRSPGGEHGTLLQYSCLENPVDRGAWRAIVHRVTKSETLLKHLLTHAHNVNHKGKEFFSNTWALQKY